MRFLQLTVGICMACNRAYTIMQQAWHGRGGGWGARGRMVSSEGSRVFMSSGRKTGGAFVIVVRAVT